MHWMLRPGLVGNLLALVAGALAVLALAPFDLWPLALLSPALFYLGLRELPARQAFARGFCYGFGLFFGGVHWVYVSIHDYGAAPPWLAAVLTLVFCAGLALLPAVSALLWARFLRRDNAPLADALAFAALWVLQEIFRSWFLGGFPWLYLGYSQLDAPLCGLFPLGGVWLASFVLVLSAVLLANLVRLRGAPLAAALALLPALWLGGWLLGGKSWTEASGAPLSVAAMQGNVAQQLKWQPEQLAAQLDLYAQMTVGARRTDLVVWPEAAIPVLKEYAVGYLAQREAFAQQRSSALITGLPLREGGRYYNAITVVGEGSGTYLKQKLVPFGEYVPLEHWLRGLIAFFDLPMSAFSAGSANQPLLEAKQQRIAPLICYEVVYPGLAADMAAGSGLLLTLSNDAWFGRSIGPRQHLQMARARALESGRWMIRATNNGITALMDPLGRIAVQIPPFEQARLYGEIQPMQGQTPWLRWQASPLLALCGLLVLASLLARRFGRD